MRRLNRLLAIAALLLSACATPTDAPLTNAIAGQTADVVITGLGLELVAATGIPLAQAEGLLSQCIVVDAPWEQVLADNGLEVHTEDEA